MIAISCRKALLCPEWLLRNTRKQAVLLSTSVELSDPRARGSLRRRMPSLHTRRTLASSSIVRDWTETIKTSMLEKAVQNDSGLWKHGPVSPSSSSSSLGDPTVQSLEEEDRLEDLDLLDVPTHYWPQLPPGVDTTADPFALTSDALASLSQTIREDLLGTDHPVLHKAASYFFDSAVEGGKKIRPMMVLLLSQALQHQHDSTNSSPREQQYQQRPDLPAAQRRLAEIAEIIHTASLFHDDVIDGADIRRGVPAVHAVFGNKTAILAGDYLLARACIGLARMRNVAVVETMSTIIEHLVRGEVMQLRGNSTEETSNARFDYYLRKNYYKTASLMANSCRSAALLGGYSAELVQASYRYGKHIGMAFQLVDDMLDFQSNISHLGKPTLADLKAGIATAPVLLAAQEHPAVLEPMVRRKFDQPGDVDAAVALVQSSSSSSMARTQQLARVHAEAAMDALLVAMPQPSVHRDALIQLAYHVVARSK